MVMKLNPSLEENTVQDIDMKCFLIGSSVYDTISCMQVRELREKQSSSGGSQKQPFNPPRDDPDLPINSREDDDHTNDEETINTTKVSTEKTTDFTDDDSSVATSNVWTEKNSAETTKYVTTDATTDSTTEIRTDSTANVTSDAATDITTDVTTDVTTDITTDITTDATATVTNVVTTDANISATADITTKVTPEQTSDSTTNSIFEATTDATTDMTTVVTQYVTSEIPTEFTIDLTSHNPNERTTLHDDETTVKQTVTTMGTTAEPAPDDPDVKPADYLGRNLDVSLSLMWNEEYNPELDDRNSELYTEYSNDVESVVHEEFRFTLGYKWTELSGFYNWESVEQPTQRKSFNQISKLNTRQPGIVAVYEVFYDLELTITEQDQVTQGINDTLTSMATNDVPIREDYSLNSTYQAQVSEEFQTDAEELLYPECDIINPSPCSYDSYCVKTPDEDGYECVHKCRDYPGCGPLEDCFIDDFYQPDCKCKSNTLTTSNGCIHQNVIIGIASGAGVALVAALVLVAVCLSRRIKKQREDHEALLSLLNNAVSEHNTDSESQLQFGGSPTTLDAHHRESDCSNIYHRGTTLVTPSIWQTQESHRNEIVEDFWHDIEQKATPRDGRSSPQSLTSSGIVTDYMI